MKKTLSARILLLKNTLLTKGFLYCSYLRGNKKLNIDKNVFLPLNSEIASETHIGYATGITGKITIKGMAKASIGKYCAIGADVKIITENHKMNTANLQVTLAQKYFKFNLKDTTKGEVQIGSNVWVGDSTIILPGVTIGDGAVVGSGSIVTKSIPPFAIYAGNPARLIRYRFSDNIIKQLLAIQWWNWNENKIRANRKFFTLDLVNNPNINLRKLVV